MITDVVGGSPPIETPHLKISTAVAASAAFPGLFKPLVLHARDLGATTKSVSHALRFTDGGVLDNLGSVSALRLFNASSTKYLLNARGLFDWDVATSTSFLTDTHRLFDVMMEKIRQYADSETEMAQKSSNWNVIDIRSAVASNGSPFEEVQKLVARIRTDLDLFTTDEQSILLRHGFACAEAGLVGKFSGNLPEYLPYSQNNIDPLRVPDVIRSAALRQPRIFVLDWIHIVNVLLLLVLCFGLCRVALHVMQEKPMWLIRGPEEGYAIIEKEIAVSQGPAGVVNLYILGFNMRTTLRFVERLQTDDIKNCNITLFCLDPAFVSNQSNLVPKYWSDEISENMKALRETVDQIKSSLSKKGLSVELRTYRRWPAVHGFRLKGVMTIVGLSHWENSPKSIDLDNSVNVNVLANPVQEMIVVPHDVEDLSANRLRKLFDNWLDAALQDSTVVFSTQSG